MGWFYHRRSRDNSNKFFNSGCMIGRVKEVCCRIFTFLDLQREKDNKTKLNTANMNIFTSFSLS